MFSLESIHRGDFKEYTQYTNCDIRKEKKKNTIYHLKSVAIGFFQGTQERVRNSHGKQAISVRATDGLLYLVLI